MNLKSQIRRRGRLRAGRVRVMLGLGLALPVLAARGGDPIPPAGLEAALKNARPGEEIVVANGAYPDSKLEIEGHGSEEAPITVRAETPGGVVFTGESFLELKGEHVTLDGFLFEKGHSPRKAVIALEGDRCRLMNTAIDSFNPPDPEKDDKWVTLKGTRHTVENCTFFNKTSASVTLAVWRESDAADHHVIARNHFHTRPRGAKSNGYETVRIGTSDHSASASHTTLRDNLFEACDGEMEAVSVKAGQNTISGNTFDHCAGTLTLRHGDGTHVVGNLFAGRRKKETGGIRIYGKEHRVSGNAIIGTTGRAGGAIALMAGNPDPEPNEFHRPEKILIEKNLIVANEGPAFLFDALYGDDGRTELAREVLVSVNAVSGDDLKNLFAGLDRPGLDVKLDRNQIFQGNQIPKDITATIAPPLTKNDVGAPWFRERLPER